MDRLKSRLRYIVIGCTVFFLVITGRVFYLTFASSGGPTSREPMVIRGPIVDRRGVALALTEEASTIGISAREIQDPEFTAAHLGRYLGMTSEEVLQQFYINKNRKYFFLRRQVDNVVADQIMDLRLPGVQRESEFRRVYPAETLAANLLGFVGRDQTRALDGLERIFHERLTEPEKNSPGRGPALYLTLDSLFQYRLEKVLGETFIESGAERAVGVFMDVESGEIMALANFPNYNPNEYYRSSPDQRANSAIRFNYEPGSTVKIFMAAILVQEGLIKDGERFFCPGEVHFNNQTVRCKSGTRIIRHGSLSLPEIIQRSCNVGIIKATRRLKKEVLYAYLKKLGFGEKTEILPAGSGETEGYLPTLDNWVPSSTYYIPIGQSFSVTPIQLLRASASIANGGRLLRPRIASKFIDSDGKVLHEEHTEVQPGPFTPETSAAVVEMMRRVVTHGTGTRANLAEMPIAGKTGTGQKASARGYSEKYVTSFIGFFPADKPRYAGLIVFDEAGSNEAGGTIAAPVFAKVVQAILPIIKQGSQQVAVEKLDPAPVRPQRKTGPGLLPDLRGLSAREVFTITTAYPDIKVELRGSGYVFRQEPGPGTSLKRVQNLVLYLEEGN